MLEVLIAAGLSFLILFLMLTLHGTGHKVWRKSSARSESLGRIQAALRSIKQELLRAPFSALSLAPTGDALALSSVEDVNGQRLYTADGSLVWHHWVLYYKNDTKLLRKTIPWDVPPEERVAPVPLLPLPDHMNGQGRTLAGEIKTLRFSNPIDTRLVEIEIETTGSEDARGLSLKSTVRPRN